MTIQRWCLLLLTALSLMVPGALAQMDAPPATGSEAAAQEGFKCPGIPPKRTHEQIAQDAKRMSADSNAAAEYRKHAIPADITAHKSAAEAAGAATEQHYTVGIVESIEGEIPNSSDASKGARTWIQKVLVKLDSDLKEEGLKQGAIVPVYNEISENPAFNTNAVHTGSRVLLAVERGPHGRTFYIANLNRTPALMILGGILVLAILLLGGREVVKQILLAGLLLFGTYQLLFPSVLAGRHPGTWAFVFCIAFVVLASYFYRGKANKTFTSQQVIAILGSIGGLSIMGTLIAIMHLITPLNGFISEGLAALWYSYPCLDYWGMYEGAGLITFQGFIFYIAWTLAQQRKEGENLGFRQRFDILMLRGRRLVGPILSSLSLLFIGLFTPLLLQWQTEGMEQSEFANSELTAAVITVGFTGALTLLLTVPLTAMIACWILAKAQAENDAVAASPVTTASAPSETETVADLTDEQSGS